LVYAYFGYPLVLWILTRFRSQDVMRKPIFPRVSIVIAARNEADKIRHKIDSTLALDYPEERLEVLIASDASDDATDEIVRE
jgi:cellulose synthase/poly-beta-1,6-N-acetylglucosamine synthase-like glycosyltransferase